MEEWITSLVTHFGDTFQSQFSQTLAMFGLAAWIHSGRVKKEIAAQTGNVVSAVNNLALALRQDLASQASRIDVVENRVDALEELETH